MNTTEKNRIIDYEIAVANNSSVDLVIQVQQAIKDGWQPHGSAYQNDGIHYQPLVKYTTQQKEAGDE